MREALLVEALLNSSDPPHQLALSFFSASLGNIKLPSPADLSDEVDLPRFTDWRDFLGSNKSFPQDVAQQWSLFLDSRNIDVRFCKGLDSSFLSTTGLWALFEDHMSVINQVLANSHILHYSVDFLYIDNLLLHWHN